MINVGVNIQGGITASAYMGGLTVVRPCPEPPIGFYGNFLTSLDTGNGFSNWTINYDGNTYSGGEFLGLFQSLGGNWLEGGSGALGNSAYFYIKAVTIATDLVIYNQDLNMILTVTNLELNTANPSICYTIEIPTPLNLASQLTLFSNGDGYSQFGYITTEPLVSAFYNTDEFAEQMQVFVQTALGNNTSSVEVTIGVNITINFYHLYIIPTFWFDFNQGGSGTYSPSPISCP